MTYISKIQFALFFSLVVFAFSSCDPEERVTDITQFPRMKAISMDVPEISENALVKVELSWAYTSDVEVDFTTVASEFSPATVDEDYEAQSGTLVIPAGQSEGIISIRLYDDIVNEGNEQFVVQLSNPQLAKLIVTTATVTIVEDDEGFVIDGSGYEAPEQYQGFTKVWEDNFDGNAIDTDHWTHEIGGGGWGNNELQYYTDRSNNSFVTSGYLVIEAKEESFGGRDYTSARLISQDKQEFQYGRLDIRAKLPEGKGLWPAIWMLGQDFQDVGWPRCGEIDIMELIGSSPQIVHGTAHYGNESGIHSFMGSSTFLSGGKKFSEEFHVFSVVWRENYIQWQMDGVPFYTLEPSDIGDGVWPFNDSFFFILNVAVGGNWPGSPNDNTVFPQRMIVDYVRVFQS